MPSEKAVGAMPTQKRESRKRNRQETCVREAPSAAYKKAAEGACFLMVLFNFSAAVTADFTLLLIGQYLLPVLLLIYSIRRTKQEILP